MWHKSSEAKPSLQTSDAPAPAPIKSQMASETTSQPAGRAAPRPAPVFAAPTAGTAAAPDSSSASRIGSGLKISGEVSGDSDLYINGDVQGKIRLGKGRLTVGPNGHVQADIEAREIVIDGAVRGNLKAAEGVHLGASSHLQGSIFAPRIAIDDGARLRGKVDMTRPADSGGDAAAGKSSDSEALRPVPAGTKSE